MSIPTPGNVKAFTLTQVQGVSIPLQRGKKFRVAIDSGGSTFEVNAFILTAEEATKLGVSRVRSELVASGTTDVEGQVFDAGFGQLEIQLTNFVGTLRVDLVEFTTGGNS